jgi:hypothetical protein
MSWWLVMFPRFRAHESQQPISHRLLCSGCPRRTDDYTDKAHLYLVASAWAAVSELPESQGREQHPSPGRREECWTRSSVKCTRAVIVPLAFLLGEAVHNVEQEPRLPTDAPETVNRLFVQKVEYVLANSK